MNKFVGKEISFIPEVLKDDYLIGHSGNYLSVKCHGDLLDHDSHTVIAREVQYPYLICETLEK
jgi:hypothetical protein